MLPTMGPSCPHNPVEGLGYVHKNTITTVSELELEVTKSITNFSNADMCTCFGVPPAEKDPH